MIPQQKIQVNNYHTRTETRDGQQYIVVPVVMMVEGVHHGSAGAIYHTAEELGKDIEKWNGIPVVINHPMQGDNYISANSPGVQAVGRVDNVRMDGTKLKAEAWLSETKLLAVSPDALQHIRDARPMDVSVGIYSEDLVLEGDWNGEQYQAVATNYRPDHLALLPADRGACSWNDGCGIRANKQTNDKTTNDMEKLTINQLIEQCKLVTDLKVNEQSVTQMMDLVWNAINAKDTQTETYYLEEVYETYIIYQKQSQTDTTYYKADYMIKDGVAEIGEGTKVEKVITWRSLEVNEEEHTPQNNQDINKNTNEMEQCCKEVIDKIINSNANALTEDDREWLEKLTPEQVAKIDTAEEMVVTPEEVQSYITKLPDDKIIEMLPEGLRANVRSAMAEREAKRQKSITEIMTYSGDIWTKEDLEAMPCDTLAKIERSLQPGVYAGQGGGQAPQTKGETPLPLPGQKKE